MGRTRRMGHQTLGLRAALRRADRSRLIPCPDRLLRARPQPRARPRARGARGGAEPRAERGA
eukprot:3303879-Prymnesium_polylepis.1